jgi:hypothetical protein
VKNVANLREPSLGPQSRDQFGFIPPDVAFVTDEQTAQSL